MAPALARRSRLVVAATLAAVPVAVPAALPDEIQVYTDAINAPGQRSLELHVNTTPRGQREPGYDGERVTHHGTRVTPEFALGVTPSFEVGLYVPVAFDEAFHGEVAGIKPRAKWLPIRPANGASGWFAGVNFELSRVARRYDAARTNLEMRNIVGWRDADWSFAVNPVFGWGLAAGHRGAPEFKLAARAMYRVAAGVSVGVEHYAAYGPANRFVDAAQRERTLYAVGEVALPNGWALHLGVGRGHGPADAWTVKSIVSVGL